jgi:hypothetical protein
VTWFGTEDPTGVHDRHSLSIACEINPPKRGIDRRVGGLLLRDLHGEYYLAHRGNLGGGKRGVSRKAFLASLAGHVEAILLSNGVEERAVVLGSLTSRRFLDRLSWYIHRAQQFKDIIKAGGPPLGSPSSEPELGHGLFSPEFAGKRRSYKPSDRVDSYCDHGYVVNALAEELLRNGLRPDRDVRRDVFVDARPPSPGLLFEAKTSVDPPDIYAAIGQLMLHGLVTRVQPIRILVVPRNLDKTTSSRLSALDIEILTYQLEGTTARFPGLQTLLGKLGVAETELN